MFTATVIDPIALYSGTSLAFGTVKTATASAAKSITLTNIGLTSLSVSSIAFTGADPGDFTQTNTCTAAVASEKSCTISVTFKPAVKAARSTTMVVTTNAQSGTQSIALSGTGD